LIGEEIPKETIKRILSSLEIKVNNVTESGLGLTIPSYRNDVNREVDVIEEILRVYGYNNIGTQNKLNSSISNSSKLSSYKIENVIANQLVSYGFYEIITNSLTNQKHIKYSNPNKQGEYVKILNPLSSDLSVLKTSMLFAGLEAIEHNLNRQQNDLRLFEFGKTYHEINDSREEFNHLSLFLTGKDNHVHWKNSNENIDIFYIKGIVVSILEKLGINNFKEKTSENKIFNHGQELIIKNEIVLEYGQIENSLTDEFSINQNVFYANFYWDSIVKLIILNNTKFKPIPKFPEVKRDFSLLINDNVNFDSILKIARKNNKKFIKDINLFDVYNGEKLPKGKKSYSISFTLQDDTKTLTDSEIDKIMSKLENSFKKELGAVLR